MAHPTPLAPTAPFERPERPALAGRLDLLGERVRPSSMAGERVLPLVPPLAALVPGGGLRRGSSVAVAGPGATALGLAVLAGASQAGAWVAAVGVPTLGLLAAAELGVDLERVVLVAAPAPEQWGTVVAALAEAFEAVLVRPTHRVRPGDLRRLTTRVRDRGGVLCQLPARPGTWPEVPDLTFTVTAARWRGIDPGAPGAGRLQARRLSVEVTGRRGADRPRRAELWLPGPDGSITLARPVAETTSVAPILEAVG